MESNIKLNIGVFSVLVKDVYEFLDELSEEMMDSEIFVKCDGELRTISDISINDDGNIILEI